MDAKLLVLKLNTFVVSRTMLREYSKNPNTIFNIGNMFPSKSKFMKIYWLKRPSIRPDFRVLPASKGIQSWFPQMKLNNSGAKFKHKTSVAIIHVDIAFLDSLNVFVKLDMLYFSVYLLV